MSPLPERQRILHIFRGSKERKSPFSFRPAVKSSGVGNNNNIGEQIGNSAATMNMMAQKQTSTMLTLAAAAAASSAIPAAAKIDLEDDIVDSIDRAVLEGNDVCAVEGDSQHQQLGLSCEKNKKQSKTKTSPSPVASSSLSAFDPPSEVMINLDFVPPSPMRDPSMVVKEKHGGKQRRTPTTSVACDLDMFLRQHHPESKGANIADGQVGLRTQLWDAQRLVRVILGRACTDGTLENGAILQAIRVFAVMKQELLDLKQERQQEEEERQQQKQQPNTPQKSTNSNNTKEDSQHNPPVTYNRTAIVEAAKKIQCLERQLKEANEKVRKLEQDREDFPVTATTLNVNSKEDDKILHDLQTANLAGQRRLVHVKQEKDQLQFQLDESERKLKESRLQYQDLSNKHKLYVQESKTQVEDIFMRLHSVSKHQVDTNQAEEVRTKLQVFLETVADHSSQAQIDDLKLKLQEEKTNAQKEINDKQAKLEDLQQMTAMYRQQLEAVDVRHSDRDESKVQLHQDELEISVRESQAPPKDLDTSANAVDVASSSLPRDPSRPELEEILIRLNAVPASAVPSHEREKIRNHVMQILQRMAAVQNKQELQILQSQLKKSKENERKTKDCMHQLRRQLKTLQSQAENHGRGMKEGVDSLSESFQAQLIACKEREQASVSEMQKIERTLDDNLSHAAVHPDNLPQELTCGRAAGSLGVHISDVKRQASGASDQACLMSTQTLRKDGGKLQSLEDQIQELQELLCAHRKELREARCDLEEKEARIVSLERELEQRAAEGELVVSAKLGIVEDANEADSVTPPPANLLQMKTELSQRKDEYQYLSAQTTDIKHQLASAKLQIEDLQAERKTLLAKVGELTNMMNTVHTLQKKVEDRDITIHSLQIECQAQDTKLAEVEELLVKHEEMEDAQVKLQSSILRVVELLNASQARADHLQNERDLAVARASGLSMQLAESRARMDELVERLERLDNVSLSASPSRDVRSSPLGSRGRGSSSARKKQGASLFSALLSPKGGRQQRSNCATVETGERVSKEQDATVDENASPRERAQLETIQYLKEKIENLEEQNADHRTNVNILRGTLEEVQKGRQVLPCVSTSDDREDGVIMSTKASFVGSESTVTTTTESEHSPDDIVKELQDSNEQYEGLRSQLSILRERASFHTHSSMRKMSEVTRIKSQSKQ